MWMHLNPWGAEEDDEIEEIVVHALLQQRVQVQRQLLAISGPLKVIEKPSFLFAYHGSSEVKVYPPFLAKFLW
jgi:hypothetical protein